MAKIGQDDQSGNGDIIFDGEDDPELVNAWEEDEPPHPVYITTGRYDEEEEGVVCYFGTEGVEKTYLAILRCVCIAAGLPYLGCTTRRGPVIFYDFERNKKKWLRRVYKVARGLGLGEPPKGLHYRQMVPSLLNQIEV